MPGDSTPAMTRAQMLAAVPVRNAAVQWSREAREAGGPELSLLRIPRRSDRLGRMVAALFQVPEVRKLELDEIGSDVWEWCDGTRNVAAVTGAVCEKYRLNRRQAEASVAAYLKILQERRLIAITLRPAGSAPTAGRRPSPTGKTRRR